MKPNIGTSGRLIRALIAVPLAVGAGLLWRQSWTVALLLGIGAAFSLFEAVRGWCALRACGVRTPF